MIWTLNSSRLDSPGVVGLTATMIVAAKSLSKGGPTIIKGASQMVIFAAAIKVLASACEDLSAT